jgi:hypothetical protein
VPPRRAAAFDQDDAFFHVSGGAELFMREGPVPPKLQSRIDQKLAAACRKRCRFTANPKAFLVRLRTALYMPMADMGLPLLEAQVQTFRPGHAKKNNTEPLVRCKKSSLRRGSSRVHEVQPHPKIAPLAEE